MQLSTEIQTNNFSYVHLAFYYYSLRDYIKSIENCDLYMIYYPNDSIVKEIKASCLLNLAQINYELKNIKMYIDFLDESINLISANLNIYVENSKKLFKLKEYEKALEYAEKALQLDPNNRIIKDILSDSKKCINQDWNYYSIYC
jgi:tetratricopeptide (TPR) repeat protein